MQQQSLEVGHLNHQRRIYIADMLLSNLILTNNARHRICCLQDEVTVRALHQLQRLRLWRDHGGRGTEPEAGSHRGHRGRELRLLRQLRRLGGDLSNVERDGGRLRGQWGVGNCV